ncbi:uncharacterized protein LOC143274949 [Babylonia areolata]|uniref:uncharacterized protein LOC143274949 n=1 Tax=Babylonia areolata TaxID=304850 RepID=UPI003FD698AE
MEFVKIGKELGLTGEDLKKYVDEQERKQQEIEREERAAERSLKKIQLEIEERESQRQYQDREKQREYEIRMAELRSENGESIAQTEVHIAKRPRLPAFVDEKDNIDSYLERFERHAKAMKWPGDQWATDLGALLTGHALEVYSRLSREDADDYEKLKSALLRSYDFSEQGFQKRFRSSRPEKNESPAQFLTRIQNYLERWVELAEKNKDYEGLSYLVLKEQFMDSCPRDVQSFLLQEKDQSLKSLTEAAQRFLESQRQSFDAKPKPATLQSDKLRPVQGSNQFGSPVKCFNCGRLGHKVVECRAPKKASSQNVKPEERKFQGQFGNRRNVTSANVAIREGSHNRCQNQNWSEGQENPEKHEAVVRCAFVNRNEGDLSTMPVVKGLYDSKEVNVLRDTGYSGVIIRKDLVPEEQLTGKNSFLRCVHGHVESVPTADIEVSTPFFVGKVNALCLPSPPNDVIIGNIDGARAADNPDHEWGHTCAVTTRAQAKEEKKKMTPLKVSEPTGIPDVNREKLIQSQQADPSLKKYNKANTVTRENAEVSFDKRNGVMYRLFKKLSGGQTVRQILVPADLRTPVMKLAHESIFGGHIGIKKTTDKIMAAFYWPGVHGDVARFCRSCDVCQKTEPKGKTPKVPLEKMPLVDRPFKRVAIDLIGEIKPASESGHRYILTLMDYATRYPEAVPLKRIDTETVAETLVDLFSRLGVPDEILSDLGTQFVSNCMKEVARLLSIRQLTTTPYHPMCNGLVEKYNGTLKSMLKKLCADQPRQWHHFINSLLFAYREVPQESTGFSPFELLYGRTVRGPMHILKELWTKEVESPEVKNSYQYVVELRERLEDTLQLARRELEKSQGKSKHYYDRKTKVRRFMTGDKVLVLLPSDHNKLLMQWKGPYPVEAVKGLNDYGVKIKGKQKIFHANLLKKYTERELDESTTDAHAAEIHEWALYNSCETSNEPIDEESVNDEELLEFSDLRSQETVDCVALGPQLVSKQQTDARDLLNEYSELFTEFPGRTDLVQHDIKLTSSTPVRSKPYPMPYATRESLKGDIQEMLKLGVIRESTGSPYASPVVVVKKKDGTNRVCIDFRRLNKLTHLDPEPMPTATDLFQRLSGSKIFFKIDLSKGYWQVPIPEEDIPKTAFVTPDGTYEFLRMPFGMKNSGATLKRGMRKLMGNMEGVVFYWDDILIHSETWGQHLDILREVFKRLSGAHLTARPSKCIIGADNIDFIGHSLQEGVKGVLEDNVKKILEASSPHTKKQMRSFLGMVGFYREYMPHFATVTAPLSDLLRKGKPNQLEWGEAQERAFSTVKKFLTTEPVLRLPDPSKTFVLAADASDEGVGAVLMQEHEGKLFPVSYASKKLSRAERKYATMEKECLAIVWAVRKFELYLQGVCFVLRTDHQPLSFLNSAKFLNNRVMRWPLYLQNFDMKVEHVKGTDNHTADFLSRM